MPPQKQAALIEEGLDLSCEQLFNEISIKVMLEPDDGVTKEICSPLTEEELTAYNALVNSPNKIHPSSVFGVPTSEIPDGVASADANDLQCCAEDDTAEGQDGMGGSTSPIIPLYWTPSRWDRVTVGLPYPRPLHQRTRSLRAKQVWGALHRPLPPSLWTPSCQDRVTTSLPCPRPLHRRTTSTRTR
jgi:hypothetical protein